MLKQKVINVIAAGLSALGCSAEVYSQDIKRPNILLITVDDMNYNSVGVYGCPVKNTTPNIDRLAAEGLMVRHGYVQAGASMPSRNVLATGLYGYNSGVTGFNHIPEDSPVVSYFDILKDNGYYTGCFAKLSHCFPKKSGPDNVDMAVPSTALSQGRDPQLFYKYTKEFLSEAGKSGKPFFLMANSQDPHRPFYKQRGYGAPKKDNPNGKEPPKPSYIYTEKEVSIPGFLPSLPDISTEMSQYYSSVRRADDTLGEILRALAEAGMEENTLVIFLSDNGISMPFAKTNCYMNSNRTPLIIKWPAVMAKGRIEKKALVSGVDILPTMLDILALKAPYKLDGVSFRRLIEGRPYTGPSHVYTFFETNAGQNAVTMRGIQDKEFLYVFSPWADGVRKFTSETKSGLTYKAMVGAAKGDEAIAGRVKFFDYRTTEELYDLRKDPDALENLVHDKAHTGTLEKYRAAMKRKMEETGDHALEAFLVRDDLQALRAYMDAQQAKADKFKKTIVQTAR